MLGKRVNKFTPFVMISHVKSEKHTLPPANGDPAGEYFQTFFQNRFSDFVLSQQTVTIGARWDIGSHTALKFQFDDTTDKAPPFKYTEFFNPPTKFRKWSVSLDFIF
jgi:hypothetical protein